MDETEMECSIILRNFNSLRENIDPRYLLAKLYDAGFLERDSVIVQNSHSRSIISMQVMIAVTKKIGIPGSFHAFQKILSQYHGYCEENFLKHPTASCYKKGPDDITNHEISIIENEMSRLKTEKFLNIIGTFLEESIFNLNDIEEILSHIIAGDQRQSASLLLEKVNAHIKKGSFSCLIHGMKKYTKEGDMPRIRKKYLNEDEAHAGHTLLTSTRLETAHKIAMKNVLENVSLDEVFNVVDIKEGSIIIYLKCGQKMTEKEVNSKFFKKGGILESLMPILHDKEMKEICPGISFVAVGCEIIVRAGETGDEKHVPLTVIEANKSFLIEEIDTGTLLAAFEKRDKSYIDCFARNGLDLHGDRRTRATKFLEVVDSENETKLLMDILKEHEMEYIIERLTTYERISGTDVDISILEKCLYSEFQQLTRLLEVDDIEDVFVDRQIFDPRILDEIHETFGDKSVAVMLLKIINSGKMAMLTLVELLHLKQECKLADGFLKSASVEMSSQEEQHRNVQTTGCIRQTNGTEFLLTIHIVDITGMGLLNTDVIIQNNTFVPATETDKIKHGMGLQQNDAIIKESTILLKEDDVCVDKMKHGMGLQQNDATIKESTILLKEDDVCVDKMKHGSALKKSDAIYQTHTLISDIDGIYNPNTLVIKTDKNLEDKMKIDIDLQEIDELKQSTALIPTTRAFFYGDIKHEMDRLTPHMSIQSKKFIPTIFDYEFKYEMDLSKLHMFMLGKMILSTMKTICNDEMKHGKQVFANHRKRYALPAEHQDAFIDKINKLSNGVNCNYNSEDIHQSGCVIDSERNVMCYDGSTIYRGNCKILQYALPFSDGVASWFEGQGDNTIIYIQSRTLSVEKTQHIKSLPFGSFSKEFFMEKEHAQYLPLDN